MIAIVDYGMGNLRSVSKAFKKVGVDALVTSRPSDIDNASAVVLPGVGAFRDCMRNLADLNILEAIVKSIEKGKPYLGICLGLQILFSESMEFGSNRGLNIFSGKVVRFTGDHLKIPHMGWNTVTLKKCPPIFEGVNNNSYFYFVHSYYVAPDDSSIIGGTTRYGRDFTSMVWKDNVMATQFHPEKSQQLGLAVFRNFGDFAKKN
jgi:glutamine amidotransferase